MQGDVISNTLLPLMLAFIMLSLGLGLTLEDFRRIARQPLALGIGLFCHFVLLPVTAFALIHLFGLSGLLAVGFMLVAACPTGTTSNLLTYLARGDVALALSFTAVASVVTIFTLPLIVSWAMTYFLATREIVPVPVGLMMGQIVLMLALPVSLGMLARRFWPARAIAFEPIATKLSTLCFVLIVIGALIRSWPLFRDNFATLAPMAVTLNLTMLAGGFALAWLARLNRRQAVTLGIETAVQNATLAIVIGSTVMQRDALAVPGAIYGVLMYAGGLLFALGMRRFIARDLPLPPPRAA